MLLTPITKPRKLTSFLKNLYFLSTILNPNLSSRLSTCLIFFIYYSWVPLVKINISSIYTIAVMSRMSLRTLLTTSQYIASTLVSPIGITKNLYSLQYVLKAVFYSLLGTICTTQKASLKSIFEYQVTFIRQFFISLIFSRGYWFFYVTILSRQQLITIRSFPSFFRINITSKVANDYNFLIYPLASFLSNYFCYSSSSLLDSRQSSSYSRSLLGQSLIS